MKKINGILIFSLAIVLGLIVACEQESLQEEVSTTSNGVENRNAVVVSNNVLLDDGIMDFADEFAFENFMHYLDSVGVEDFLTFVNSHGYINYCDPALGTCPVTSTGEELDEPELMAILNEYSMVHIGDHIMKLNFEEEEVYVVPDDATTVEMQQLQSAQNILSLPGSTMIIPFQENVFDIINGDDGSGSDPQNLGLCNPESTKDRKDRTTSDPDIPCQTIIPECDFQGEVFAKYFKGGIWFRLFAEFGIVSTSCVVYTNYTMNIDADWNECGPNGVGSFDDSVSGDLADIEAFSVKEVLYSGRKRLKTYSLSVDADFCTKDRVLNTGTADIESGAE